MKHFLFYWFFRKEIQLWRNRLNRANEEIAIANTLRDHWRETAAHHKTRAEGFQKEARKWKDEYLALVEDNADFETVPAQTALKKTTLSEWENEEMKSAFWRAYDYNDQAFTIYIAEQKVVDGQIIAQVNRTVTVCLMCQKERIANDVWLLIRPLKDEYFWVQCVVGAQSSSEKLDIAETIDQMETAMSVPREEAAKLFTTLCWKEEEEWVNPMVAKLLPKE